MVLWRGDKGPRGRIPWRGREEQAERMEPSREQKPAREPETTPLEPLEAKAAQLANTLDIPADKAEGVRNVVEDSPNKPGSGAIGKTITEPMGILGEVGNKEKDKDFGRFTE